MKGWATFLVLLATRIVVAGDGDEFVVRARSLELAVREVGNGWREWQGFPLNTSERVSALYVTPADADPAVRGVWVGTSEGWLYHGTGDNWTIEAGALDTEITGIAVRQDGETSGSSYTLLLSTSDGIRTVGPFSRLHEKARTVRSTRSYYAAAPAVSPFVSVVPEYQRPMGFVDDILVRSMRFSEPVAITSEHGVLFNLGPYWLIDCHRSSLASERLTWFDPDAPIPHRRPTCVIEDSGGNLWLGTDGDGIVRIDAGTRLLHTPKEDPYFARYSPDDIGCRFTRVTDAKRGFNDSLWFTLTDYGRHSFVARFQNDEWSVVELPQREVKYRGDETRHYPVVPVSLAETAPGSLLIGAEYAGNLQLDWETRLFERITEFKTPLLEIEVSQDGGVWATTSKSVYQRMPQSE